MGTSPAKSISSTFADYSQEIDLESSIESKEGERPVNLSLRNLKIATYILALAISIQLGLPAQLSAQVVGATLSGTVTDTSGGVVPNAEVTAKNVSNGITRTATTNGSGLFTVPNLQPGPYEITVAAGGFNTDVRTGITLNVGQELVLNFTVKPGMAVQKVEVNAEAPTVNLANATIGGINDSTTVAELPLNGRSWTDLATLQPGVHLAQDQPPINAGDRIKRGLGLELTISGGRPQQNNYMLDGVNINDYANAGPGSVLGGNLGTDAVAEFSILTTNYAAEYGRTSGGVISAVTKSGSNQFHGSAYEFLRNSALDARNFFDPPVIPPFRRNQYGGSAGGPIQKDKTFIFGDYEGVKQALGTTSIQNVPSLAARNGTIFFQGQAPDNCAAIPGNTAQCQLTVDPNIAQFLNSGLIPLPNPATVAPGSNAGQFRFGAFQNTLENFFTIRADHNFSDKDRIFTTYLFDKASQSEPDEYATKLLHNPMLRQMVAIEENHVITPNLLNSARFGFNRDNVESPSGATAIVPAAADTSLGFVPGSTVGNIVIGSDNLAGYSGGLDVAAPFKFHWNSIQGYDNLFYTKGIHSMKFGVNVERLRGNTFGADFPGGQLLFNGHGTNNTGLSDFLTNQSGAINADVPGKVTGRGTRQTIFGAYFQDDTHVRPNLSVNWGLRYETASIIAEEAGKLANLRVLSSLAPVTPGFPNPTNSTYINHLGSPYIMNPTKRNFEPRVGFAWDPFKDGKTSVAGGFGLFDVLPLPVEMGSGVDGSFPADSAYSGTGFSTPFITNGNGGGNCPANGGSAYCQAQANQSSRYYIMQFDPKRNYVMQWNFNIQRQISGGTSLMLGYVGARGRHMRFQADDVNMVYPTNLTTKLPSEQYIWPTPGTGTIFNQFMGRTQMALFDGNYYYNGLQVQFKKAMSHGFQIESSYTWSKNIDDGGGSVASDPFRNSISTLLWFCERCRRSLSDQDQRHNLTMNYVWDIPTPASFSGIPKAVLGNWEAGGILTIQSGTPFTVLVQGDPLGEGNTDPYQFPDRVNGPGCDNPVNPQNANGYVKLQCFAAPSPVNRLGTSGRNALIGPGLIDMDFSLFKNIPVPKISEAFKAQFRTEIFNIFNRPNFTAPNDNRVIMDSSGNNPSSAGVFTLTNTTSRQIQFALKLTW